ncbi:MAG: AAA domain-containing protein, partial [Campylobacterales bacterium]
MRGGEPILDYLLYLREVSRKIGRQQQLEKVFVARSSNRNVFQITSANREVQRKWLERAGEKLERESGKGLFLGVGALFGNGKVGGPLLYLELEWNREKRKWQYDISTLSLNLDLVARLLEGERGEWEEEHLLLDQTSEVIEKVERILEGVSSTEELGRVGLEVLKLLEEIRGFPKVEIGPFEGYSFEREQKLLKNRRSRGDALYFQQKYQYFPAFHFFIAPVPDELSTYASLSQLIGEVERGGFKNRVVVKLLKGVFHRGRIQFQEKVWEEIERRVEEMLPLPLSDLQWEGVKRSFAHEISYIQGPPGTGKSHTIAAVALTAIGAGKRVLIVSQKVPAVEVLKEKLTPFLENSNQILPFVYYTKGARRELREQIRKILDRYTSSRILKEELDRTKARLAQLEEKLERVKGRKERLERELRENLELEFQFVEENEALQRKKREFQELYYQLEKAEELASPRRVAQLKGLVRELRELKERDRVERLPTLLFQLNLIYNLQAHLPNRGGTPAIFEKALRKGELLPMVERLLEIEEQILQLEELGSTLRGNSDTLRRELELLVEEERGYQRKLLQLRNKLRILERLAQPR